MSANRARRIAKEIAEISNDHLSGVTVESFEGDSLTHLRGRFRGPPDTPYEGGTFDVDIVIPPEYPFRPPNMKFITKLWHPNVSSVTGAICLDTLSSQWSPVLTIKNALISLQSLLSTPEPKDPQDAEVASMMIKNPKEFEHVARDWAVKYAGAPKREIAEGSGGATADSIRRKAQQSKEKEEKVRLAAYHGYNKDLIDRFVAMGFDVESVVSAFEYVGIDRNGGEDYTLEEAYMGDITARLFGEA
jgi:ubiquitin-conjugating enzyme (huntingtin interacting protein 2)